jgi:hypothetical protein
MPRGGHASSGPRQDPMAIRRDRPSDSAGWTVLPSKRTGEVPPWPLEKATERELYLWADYWARPQSVIWERDQLFVMVGLFVRQLVEAEKPTSSAENRKTVRMMFADLMLTPHALANAKYRIAEDEAPAAARPRFRTAPVASHLSVVVPPTEVA